MACQSALNSLKKMVIKVPILVYYKQNIKTVLETNSFDYVSSGVFFQLGNDKLVYPIAFFFKNLNSVKCNYEIYDKEL